MTGWAGAEVVVGRQERAQQPPNNGLSLQNVPPDMQPAHNAAYHDLHVKKSIQRAAYRMHDSAACRGP
jgi:hypothetical protein